MAFADALDGEPVSLMHDENTHLQIQIHLQIKIRSQMLKRRCSVNPQRPTFLHLSPKICLKDLKGICRLVRQRIAKCSNIYYNEHYILPSMCTIECQWSVAVTMHLELNEFL